MTGDFQQQRRWLVALAALACLVVIASGCGSGSSTNGTSTPSPAVGSNQGASGNQSAGGGKSGSAPQAKKPGRNASADQFAPSLFDKRLEAGNPFLPLKPGTQWVRQGTVDVGNRTIPHEVVTTVADVSKMIDGVRTVAVLDQDTNGGQIAEQSIDWLAEDKQGNVWLLGSYTESYEGGQFVAAFDAWLGGTNGAKPGILMLADPKTGTPEYTEDTVPGIEAPTAQVSATDQSQCVPFKCYKGVLVISEGGELKSFAPGVGQIQTEPPAGGGKQEIEKLINLRHLSSAGLNQIDSLVLKLDRNAKTQAPSVFGSSPAAQRGF